MSFSIMTLSKTTLYYYAEFRYGECHVLFVVIQSILMLSVVMSSVILLSVVWLSVVFYLFLC
jgi:hypothetical protein